MRFVLHPIKPELVVALGTSFQDFARVTRTAALYKQATQKNLAQFASRGVFVHQQLTHSNGRRNRVEEMKDGAARVRVVRRLRDHAVSVQDSGGHREHAEEDAESMFKGVRILAILGSIATAVGRR